MSTQSRNTKNTWKLYLNPLTNTLELRIKTSGAATTLPMNLESASNLYTALIAAVDLMRKLETPNGTNSKTN